MSLDFAPGYCSTCNNTGMVDCHCGGDLCICENNGEEECPDCERAAGAFICDEIEDCCDAETPEN